MALGTLNQTGTQATSEQIKLYLITGKKFPGNALNIKKD
jgi:hypothetical protein